MNLDDIARLVEVHDPQLSPDGRRVAVVLETVDEAANELRRRLVVFDVGRPDRQRTIATGKGKLGSPRWSPDGTRLAFISGVGSNAYAAGADGSGLTQLSDLVATSKVFWSPDGAKVAFHNGNVTFVDLYVVRADGSRRASNYTKTRRDDESASSWQTVR